MKDKYYFDWWLGYIAIICMFMFGVCEGCVINLFNVTPQPTTQLVALMFIGFVFFIIALLFYSKALFQRKDID
jgi:hypothetical protein